MPSKNKEQYNAYMREYMLKRYHSRMNKAREDFGGKCGVCGSVDNLEFDHIDPQTKSFTIGRMWSLSEKKFREELAKCQLLCKLHHDAKHESKALCGTPQRYWRGCRCKPCTTANSEYSKVYKHASLA